MNETYVMLYVVSAVLAVLAAAIILLTTAVSRVKNYTEDFTPATLETDMQFSPPVEILYEPGGVFDTGTNGSAGYDLRANIKEAVVIEPGCNALIQTGIRIHIADKNIVALVCARSGLALKHRIRLANGVGVVDSDYTGDVSVIAYNDGDEPYTVQPGEKMAQLLFTFVLHPNFKRVFEFTKDTTRGENGFGSTGKF